MRIFFLVMIFCCSLLSAADDGTVGVLESGSMSSVEEKGKRVLFHCVYTVKFIQRTDPWQGVLIWVGQNDFSPRIGSYYQHATPMSLSFYSYIKGLTLASGRDASKPLFVKITSSIVNDVPKLLSTNSGSYLYDSDEIPAMYFDNTYTNANASWRPESQIANINNRVDHQVDVKFYQELEVESLENGYIGANSQYRQGTNVFVLDGGIWKPAAGAYIHDATGAPRQWFGEVK